MRGLTRSLLTLVALAPVGAARAAEPWPFPWPENRIARYTAYRASGQIALDGRLDEADWGAVEKSPRFSDLVRGKPGIHDTRAAVLWDDVNLYVGYWVEEPFVEGTLTERDSLIYKNNDVELFIAGRDAYYEFEINSLGTIYEVFFIWEQAYEKAGYAQVPEFERGKAGVRPFHGVGFKNHPRGPRIGYWNWDLPGLRTAVHVDGTVNDNKDRDRGWTVELSIPWAGLAQLARPDGRSLPPKEGDVWRMDFSRFNQYKEAPPAQDPGGWAWSPHGAWDSHIPEVFPHVTFSTRPVRAARAAAPPRATASDAGVRPNIVFVLIDDLRWDEIDYPFVTAPNIQRLAREGARFRNAFVTTPLCSPSRASFLTGQYAHAHGITDNTDRTARSHELVTFPRLLHDAGYETAFLGKWHMGVDDTARPGFDHWVSVKGQGRYLDPEFNVNGERRVVRGYFTDALNDFAVEFLRKPHAKPFVLYLAHKAVHPDLTQNADGSVSDPNANLFVPAERHRRLYADAAIPHRPSHRRPPLDKPALLRLIPGRPPLGAETATDDETVRDRLRMLAAVDEGLGRMLEALAAKGALENTLVVLTSDEGYFYGEHGLSVERRLAYEESARIPLLMRWPRLIRAGTSIDALALNIDLAPTLVEIGGAPATKGMHGRSLVPLLRGEAVAWRDSFLIEYFSDSVFPWVLKLGYQAVRTERWKYIHYVDLDGMDEVYDLSSDPYEIANLAGKPAGQTALRELKPRLSSLLEESR